MSPIVIEERLFRTILCGCVFASGVIATLGYVLPDIHKFLLPLGVAAFVYFTYGFVVECTQPEDHDDLKSTIPDEPVSLLLDDDLLKKVTSDYEVKILVGYLLAVNAASIKTLLLGVTATILLIAAQCAFRK